MPSNHLTPELEAFFEHKLGRLRRVVAPQLHALADDLRPGEELQTVAFVTSGVLTGDPCLVAATDQRLILVETSSRCKTIEYEHLISVTDDADAGEVALVTPGDVYPFTLAPQPRAAELVAAVTARIGSDRVHPSAGGTQARQMQRALAGTAVTACVFVGAWAVGWGIDGALDRWQEDRRTPDRLATGVCLDVEGRLSDCKQDWAMFVVLGARDMKGCSAASPTLVESLASLKAAPRGLSRWCVGLIGASRRSG